MSSDPRRALRAAAVAVGVVWLPVLLFWDPFLHTVTVDDAFYYFTIARNVADGQGSTFDGLHPTNGYHPLWLVLCAVPYLLGLDGTAAVLVMLAVQLCLWVATLWVIGDVLASSIGRWKGFDGRADAGAARRRGTVAVAVLWFVMGANPYVLKIFVNGMETGLAALLGALVLAAAVRDDGDLAARPARAAVLLPLLFLARTDAALLIGAGLLWTVVLRRRVDRGLLVVGAALAVVVAGYLAVNVSIVDHPMQISGTTKRVDPDGGRLVTMALCVAAAVGCVGLGLRSRRDAPSRFVRLRRWVGCTAWWPAGCFLLLAYDWGLSTEVYVWHYAPHALWILATFGFTVADIYEGATLEREPDHPGAASRSRLVAAMVLLPFLAGSVATVGNTLDPELRNLQLGDRATAAWMSEHLPADAVVASADAGVIGYFTERAVVNLDGLVNSFEWYDARHEGVEDTAAFLRDAGVTHVANHGDLVDGDDPNFRGVIDGLWGEGAGDRAVVVHQERYIVNGSFGGGSGRRPYVTSVFELDPTDAGTAG